MKNRSINIYKKLSMLRVQFSIFGRFKFQPDCILNQILILFLSKSLTTTIALFKRLISLSRTLLIFVFSCLTGKKSVLRTMSCCLVKSGVLMVCSQIFIKSGEYLKNSDNEIRLKWLKSYNQKASYKEIFYITKNYKKRFLITKLCPSNCILKDVLTS